MTYLTQFTVPDADAEQAFFMDQKRTCYDSYYPFQVLSQGILSHLTFAPITILYGGNGSGKTTTLNVIAEKLGLARDTLYNRSNFFERIPSFATIPVLPPFPRKAESSPATML